MKNKGLTYALLIVVGIIWYKVFFRVLSNIQDDEEFVVQPNQSNGTLLSIHRDTFTLNASYRDPFGGSLKQHESTAIVNAPPVINTQKIKAQKVKEQWPSIKYKGLLRKTSSNNPLAIIYIDGIQLQMRKGEEVFDGILIKSIHRDSVVIVYQKEKKVFWRD